MKEINNYLNDKLPEEEHDEITKILLEKAFDQDLKEEWTGILEREYNLPPPRKRNAIRISLLWKVGAIAASILLFIVGEKVYQDYWPSLNTQELAALYIDDKFEHTNIKKSITEEGIQAKANEAYTKGDYGAAIHFYKEIPTLSGENHVFLGLSYLYNGQPEKAIPLLETAIDLTPFGDFRAPESIQWHLCLAYIENGEIKKARIVLEKIAQNKSGKKREKALKLLKSF